MQISVQGVLVDPVGNPLADHEIRITSRVTNVIVEEVETTVLTDGTGNYSFILNEGWHYLEILLNNTYMSVGDLLVNDGTPTPINLPDLLKYSDPVEVDTITYPPFWQNLIDTLEDSPLTSSRESRDQIADTLVHVAEIKTTDVGDSATERKGTYDIDVKSCDAQVTKQVLAYSDDDSNFLASDATKVTSGTISYSNEVIANDELNITGSKVTTDYVETIDININGVGLTEDRDINFKGTTYSTTLDVNDDYVASEEIIVSSLGELTHLVSLGNTTYLNSEYLDSSFDNTISHTDGLSTDTYMTTVGTKTTSDTHSNDGTSSKKEVIVDNMIVGRTGNDTFEVDTTNDVVYVRGQFRVSQLQDENGTPIEIEDGDTIFQVSQYSDSASGPWHDEIQPSDYWRRDNLSVNGVVDGGNWGIAYQFRADTAVGDDGDTIYIEYQYSPDGATSWTPTMQSGDAFRRERTVINTIPGPWSAVARIKGDNGDEIEIRSQYSIDGINNWHDDYVSGDLYERRGRFVNGVLDGAWTDPFSISGNPTFKSIVFKRQSSMPATPTGGTWADPVPSEWSDGIPAGSLQMWSSTRVFTQSGEPPAQAVWTTPRAMTDTATVDFEYSATGIGTPSSSPGNWHNTATTLDTHMAQRTITNGIYGAWQISKIKGEDGDSGDVGIPGLNGSGWYSIVGNNGVWPGDSTATAAFISTFGRSPQLDDHLFYVDQDPNPTKTDGRRCTSPAGQTVTWNTPRGYFDGDVIVKGTLSADRIVANDITGNEIDSQTTIIAGSGSTTAGLNGYDGATLPPWLGGGTNNYKDWRFWSGASLPASANFRVNDVGKMWAADADINGKIVSNEGLIAGWTIDSTYIRSHGTASTDGFMDEGIALVASSGAIRTPYFYSQSNGAAFKGDISLATGTLTAANIVANNIEGDVTDLITKTSSNGLGQVLSFNVAASTGISDAFSRKIVVTGLQASVWAAFGGTEFCTFTLKRNGSVVASAQVLVTISGTAEPVNAICPPLVHSLTSHSTGTYTVEVASSSQGDHDSQSVLIQAFKVGSTLS